MKNLRTIMEFVQAKESFEIPNRIMENLIDEDKKTAFLDFLTKNENMDTDFLRDVFQTELAERSGLKQDYTPDCICEIVSQMINENTKTISDICAGTGALSISCLSKCEYIIAEELSKMSIPMLLTNFSMRNMNAIVFNKNVLTQDIIQVWELTKSEKYSLIREMQVDQASQKNKVNAVISNPPYSVTAEIERDDRFKGYEMPPKSKMDYAFVIDGISRLKENGEAFFILPHGVLFRGGSEEKIRKQLLANNLIDCIIGLPSNLFLNTQIPVFILVLKKNRQTQNVLFINAEKQFYKSGKQNDMTKEHIKKVIEVYKERKTVDKFSEVVTPEKIAENGFNLNIPRYVDISEKETVPELKTVIDEIIFLEKEMKKAAKEIKKFIKQLHGTNNEAETYYQEAVAPLLAYIEEQEKKEKAEDLKQLEMFVEQINQNEWKVEKLLSVSTIERSKKETVYPEGSILIQVSATKGQLVYLDKASTVDSKYAVIKPKNINPKYLYIMLENEMPKFLARYQTGLNIKPEIFDYFHFKCHLDNQVQTLIAELFEKIEKLSKNQSRELEEWKKLKKYHLVKMFPE